MRIQSQRESFAFRVAGWGPSRFKIDDGDVPYKGYDFSHPSMGEGDYAHVADYSRVNGDAWALIGNAPDGNPWSYDPSHQRHVDKSFETPEEAIKHVVEHFHGSQPDTRLSKFMGGELYEHFDGRELVGQLLVFKTGAIRYIGDMWTHPQYRRRGIATALWRSAGCPYQTPGYQSSEGERWARAVGGQEIYLSPSDLPKGIPLRSANEVRDPLLDLLDPVGGGQHQPYTPPEPQPKKVEEPVEGVPQGWERYHNHIQDTPDHTENAHLMMPTELLDHYKEYERGPEDPNTQTLKKVVQEHGGIRTPLTLSTDDTHGCLTEGNHRLEVAKQLGITHVPVKVYYDQRVQSNEGQPVPHHPDFAPWLEENKHSLPSFWR